MSITEIQLISRALSNKSLDVLESNGITEDFFPSYPEEAQFLYEHFNEYGSVPDKETFLSNFPDFDILEVAEGDQYLIDTITEEHVYTVSAQVINKVADLMQTNANTAVEYLQSQLPNLISTNRKRIGVNIISEASQRYEEYKKMSENQKTFFIETGFKELDEVTGGWHKGEELVVVFARTGMGKSWVLTKMLEHAWKMKSRVGLIEPEMSASKTGYRFDTINKHFSNRALTRGEKIESYSEYVDTLATNEVPFIVAHPKDFDRRVTISKLKNFCTNNELDILAIDGISYLDDERARRGDSITQQLTDISEDLMDLSIELGIPIIVVAQSNRGGTVTEEPELENIRDSDGIAYNSSIVVSVAQKKDDNVLTLAVKKNRNGVNNVKLTYTWDIDHGEFTYVPSETDGYENSEEQAMNTRSQYKDSEERF